MSSSSSSSSSSDESDSDSILPNLQKTRELWSQKSEGFSSEQIMPKTLTSPTKSSSSIAVTSNGRATAGEVVRFEDKIDDDFEMPDVKSMKSQWETAGPVPSPKISKPDAAKGRQVSLPTEQPTEVPVPVNREPQQEEEYEVKLGALKEKFEMEAKAAKARTLWDESSRESVSKAAVDQKKNLNKTHVSSRKSTLNSSTSKTDASRERFESEIEAQKHYHSAKESSVDMPVVELSSLKQQFELRKDEKLVVPIPVNSSNHKKQRQISISSDASSQAADIVRHNDPPTQEVKFEVEVNSLRKRFEQASQSSQSAERQFSVRQRKMSDQTDGRRRVASESNDVDIVRSSDPSNDETVGIESIKERLARYKALTGATSTLTARRRFLKKRNVTNVEIDTKEVEDSENLDPNIVRSPPAGTKERPDYKASIDLEQARQIFEANSPSPRSGRSSRSSSASFRRRTPRSRSTPSPIHRGPLSTSSSKSPSPVRSSSRNSTSSRSSERRSPSPRSKSPKKFGDPDIVVLEHTAVNYYYEGDSARVVSENKRTSQDDNTSGDMSDQEIVKPPPAGTKEEADYVPSVSLRSVRDMFERNKDAETALRGREPVPKKKVDVKRAEQVEKSSHESADQSREIIKSTTAGEREEPEFQTSIDLKSARSVFESPQRVENYVPRNTIKEREEAAKRQRAAAAAASPRSSESSEASGVDVVRPSDASSKENLEYHVDLKATKKLFEGGRAPDPIKQETGIAKPKREEIKTEVIRPEPAGTKEVVQFEKSSDLLSAKQKFENTGQPETEEEFQRKDPFDIQEEKRLVMQKEQEIKEEANQSADEENVHKSEDGSTSDHADVDEVAASGSQSQDSPVPTPERRHSVSSEDLEEKEGIEEEANERLQHAQLHDDQYHTEHENEQTVIESVVDKSETVFDEQEAEGNSSGENGNEPQEPAAAVVPVRVAIPEDLTDKQETDVAQEYGNYTNVIDYNEGVQHNQSSSDSESENENKETPANDEPAVNGYSEASINQPPDANVEDTTPPVKGLTDADESVAPQQEIAADGDGNFTH